MVAAFGFCWVYKENDEREQTRQSSSFLLLVCDNETNDRDVRQTKEVRDDDYQEDQNDSLMRPNIFGRIPKAESVP